MPYDFKTIWEGYGHEGEHIFESAIVKTGKIIGICEMPDWGASPIFDFINDEEELKFDEYVLEHHKRNRDDDVYMCRLGFIDYQYAYKYKRGGDFEK